MSNVLHKLMGLIGKYKDFLELEHRDSLSQPLIK